LKILSYQKVPKDHEKWVKIEWKKRKNR